MEAVSSPPISPSSHPLFRIHPTRPTRASALQIIRRGETKPRQPLISHPRRLRARALNDALTVAANSTATGGDISGLIPVGAFMLFLYWIANFVVPQMVMKDLQASSTEEEEASQRQSNTAEDKKESIDNKQKSMAKNRGR